MSEDKVFNMPLSKVYGCLVAKVERKGGNRADVDAATSWLTGYDMQAIERLASSDITYADFFRQAPAMNPDRVGIGGKICGVDIDEIKDPLMRDIRRLDKLVDGLAKGKSVEQLCPRKG